MFFTVSLLFLKYQKVFEETLIIQYIHLYSKICRQYILVKVIYQYSSTSSCQQLNILKEILISNNTGMYSWGSPPPLFPQSASNCVHLHTWNTVNWTEFEMSLLFSMETSMELPFAATIFPDNSYEVYSTQDILSWVLK